MRGPHLQRSRSSTSTPTSTWSRATVRRWSGPGGPASDAPLEPLPAQPRRARRPLRSRRPWRDPVDRSVSSAGSTRRWPRWSNRLRRPRERGVRPRSTLSCTTHRHEVTSREEGRARRLPPACWPSSSVCRTGSTRGVLTSRRNPTSSSAIGNAAVAASRPVSGRRAWLAARDTSNVPLQPHRRCRPTTGISAGRGDRPGRRTCSATTPCSTSPR